MPDVPPDPPAADRDELARVLYEAEVARLGYDGLTFDKSCVDRGRWLVLADGLLSSGVLVDADDVRARALEDAADALENEQSPGDDTTLHFPSLLREMHVATTTANWLRDRAVSERDRGTT